MAIDWEAYKKKAKKRDEYEYQKNIANNDIAPAPVTTKLSGDDIAPPVTTKKDDSKRSFFQKSEYFADGKWDKGDLTKTILGSATDLGEKLGTGAIGSGEKLLDFFSMLGTAMNEQNLNQAAQNEMIFNTVTGKDAEGVLDNYNAFQKQAEKETAEFVAKDLYDESAIAKKIISAPIKEKTGVDSETASVFAERSDELAIATGEMVTTKLVGTILGGPAGLLMTGGTSGGSEVEEALKQGATFDEAVASGIITAGMSMGSGALFNGVKFGGETLTEGAIQKVASAVSSKTLQTLTKWGINTVGEGAEEVIEDAMSSVGKKLTYLDEKEFNEIFNSETAWESFLGGIILGGMFEGVDVGVNKIKGADYVSGSTKSEQNTLNKLVEERVSETTKEKAIEKAVNKAIEERETAQGGKFTDENKKALRETVMAQIESGEIELSSEELSKKDIAKIEKEIKKSLEDGEIELSKLEELLTPDATKEINELKDSLENTKDEQEKAEIEGKIKQLEGIRSENLKKLTRDNKYLLKASYENAMALEKYTDDTKIDDDYEKSVVESAKKHLDNTTKSKKFVNAVRKLAKDRKTRYIFTNNQELLEQGDLVVNKEISAEEQAQIKNLENQLSKATTKEDKASIQAQIIALKYLDSGGMVRVNENGVETVLINVDSMQSMYSVVGHETKHTLEKYELNKDFNKVLFDYAEAKGDLDTIKSRIEDVYEGIENVDIDGEIAAELTGKYLFEDEKFLETLMKNKSDSKVQQVIDKIKELIDDLVIRFKGTEQEKQLREVQKKFTELYNSTEADIVNETTEGTQYKLSDNAKDDVRKALKDKNFKGEVRLTDSSPSIMVGQKGVNNYPMLMNASHIRENIFTEQEALNHNLKVNKDINYHGLGEDLFFKVIDGLDDVTLAYRGTKNADNPERREDYFLLISTYTDANGETINVPVYINRKGSYNKVFIDTNKIATVFGKENFNDYIRRELQRGNLVRIKKRSIQASESTSPINADYGMNASSENGIPQNSSKVNTKHSLSYRDNQYIDAINRGDNATAQKLVDEVAEEAMPNSIIRDDNGKLLAVYHGSPSKFTVFNHSKMNTNGNAHGRGFYFTEEKSLAEGYQKNGGQLLKGYLNITNPMSEEKVTIKKPDLIKLIQAICEEEAQNMVADEGYDSVDDALPDTWISGYVYTHGMNINDAYKQVADIIYSNDNDVDIIAEMTNVTDTEIVLTKAYEVLGVDGVIYTNERGTHEYVSLVSNQFKSAEPVTYDDNGEVIPLSQRFDESNDDIRYSLSKQGENVDYSKSLRSMRYNDDLPIRQDIQKKADVLPDDTPIRSDLAPMTEDEANAMRDNVPLTDADVPPEIDVPMYDVADTTKIDDTTLKGIGQRLSETLSLTTKETKAIQEVVQKYSTTETPNSEQLFNEIKEKFSEKTWTERNEEIAEIKQTLKGFKIKVSDNIKNDIADYGEWQRSNFGKLRFSKDGLTVDDIYEGLSIGYPNFFPADVVNPTDQLLLMSEVASMDANTIGTHQLDDEIIQEATDIVISEVNKHKENELAQHLAEEQSHFYKEVIANDDLAGRREQVNEWYENRKAELHEELDDKNAFVSNKAKALYTELNGLKKGVRASEELGYFLDFGFNWSELKSTLLKVSKWSDTVINPDSNVESIVREAIGREYEDRLYDFDDLDTEYQKKLNALEKSVNSPIRTVKERLTAKLENVRKELLMNQQLRDDSIADFEQEITRLQAVYDGKRDKNTKVANDILRRIERLQTLKGNVEADYSKRISDLKEKRERLTKEMLTGESPTEQGAMRKELHESKMNNIKTQFAEKGFDFDDVLKNAKNLSTFTTVDNTPQRVMEKALGYKQGQILADETVNKVAQNESEGIKWLNSFTDKKNGLLAQISKEYNIKPGSKKSAAAQMYAEGFYVGENDEIIKYGDRELAIDFPDATDRQNIKGLANDPRIRQIYDETLDAINESRIRNAYPEIKKLDNYFLHFRAMEDTFSRLGLPFNPNDIKAKDLPTDLNGVTADLKPGQPYFASAMHRTGKRTSFDLLGGLEGYLSSAKNQIYHIDDIQTLRALRNYIAETYGQAHGLEDIDSLSEEEAQERIKQVYDSHLSTFAKFLNEEANVIAGKTALIDRGLEGVIGRRGIQLLDTVNKQVGSNMVGGNISSALTNLVSVVQAVAKTQKQDSIKAFSQMASNKINSLFGKSDGFAEINPGIVRRKGAEKFARTPYEKVKDGGYLFASAVDNVATEFIVRTKFNEYTRNGMSEEQAHIEADKWASRLLGDRSLGQQPQLYNSKMLGLFTKFQLEVRNQLDSQFYDTIQEARVSNEDIENTLERNAKTAAKVTSTFVQLAVLQHAFGMAFESIAGYNPAFDIIDVLIKAFGFDDEEESEDTPLDNLEQGFLALLEDLPYTSTLTGGRIPISSALPIKELVTGEDDYGTEKSRVETLKETLPYYLLPTGYGQVKKTAQGLKMFDDDLPTAGSYTDSGNLRFPVEDTPLNRVQAGLFGQYANENARKYFDDDIAPLNEKQIKEYADLDLPIADYWKYRERLKDFEKQDEKVAYINSLDVTDEQKNTLKSYLYDEEGYKEDNPEKYAFLENEGIGFLGYKEADDETQNAWSWAFKHQDEYRYLKENGVNPEDYSVYYSPRVEFDDEDDKAYSWAFDNPEKATIGKVFGNGVKEYRQYTSALSELKADKDSNGKSISGSLKKKKTAYINNLDIDYGAKCILFKKEYPSDDTYNTVIFNYVKGRTDITYDEKKTILEELGATVDSNGNVRW